MDHEEERRKETEYWAMFQRNVVDFMRKGLGKVTSRLHLAAIAATLMQPRSPAKNKSASSR